MRFWRAVGIGVGAAFSLLVAYAAERGTLPGFWWAAVRATMVPAYLAALVLTGVGFRRRSAPAFAVALALMSLWFPLGGYPVLRPLQSLFFIDLEVRCSLRS